MKTTLKISALILFFLSFVLGFNPSNVYAIDTNNVVLEYCTGTWCGYCPCAHQIIRQNIMPNFPSTVVIAYHGTSSDPWYPYSQTMISTFGFTGYPTGVVGRQSGIISRSSWYSYIYYLASQAPGVKIVLSNKSYNGGTRVLSANVAVTALQDLPSAQYNIFFVITENNLIYPQNSYSACGYSGYINDYVHDHVNKYAVDAPWGSMITNGAWNANVTYNIPMSITLPSHVVPANCDLNIIVYKYQPPSITSNCNVQNGSRVAVNTFPLTGISNNNTISPDKYTLYQNYPNPFNPMTKIVFTIPKSDYVTLKFYNVLGMEVATYLNNYYLTPGVYSAEFDGTNLPSGIYFYTLTTKNFTDTKKMLLVK